MMVVDLQFLSLIPCMQTF